MVQLTCNKKLLCELPAGTELQTVGAPLRFGCRQGGCGTCVVEVEEGEEHLSPPTKEEKATLKRMGAAAHCRLACQTAVKGNHSSIVGLKLKES